MTTRHLLFFLAGYLLIYGILFHGFQFVMDPDATGYFSVAEKIVRGNYFDSVNGIWSPLSSWILVPFLKFGLDPIISAKLLNGFYGFISVWIFFSIIKKFKIDFFIEISLMVGVVLLLIDFAFSRLFADMLLVLILLIYLNILCNENFGKNYRSIIWIAIIGALGFYAKAYTFYFVLIHLPLTILIIDNKKTDRLFSIISWKKIVAFLLVFLFVTSFWLIALNNKYGHYVIGQKNISGTITDIYHPKRVVVSVPPEGDYAIFDDISNLDTQNLTPFTNWRTFIVQAKITIVNIVFLIGAFNEFSFAFILILLIFLYFILSRNSLLYSSKKMLILISFVALWPLGFLLFSIQSRFIWIEDIIVMLLCGILLSKSFDSGLMKNRLLYFFSFIIISSFYIYPLWELKRQYREGKNLFDIAAALKQNNINGKMMAGFKSSDDYSNSIMINYLNHSKYYGPYTHNASMNEISEAIKTFHIDYYIFYYATAFEKDSFLNSSLTTQAAHIYDNLYPGIIVLTFKY
ncbi:MAG: hypothetical protein ABIR31_10320 [Ginsengibacter sp.]